MLWDYTIVLYWKSKEGYLHISTCILRSSILLSFLLQAVFIPKTKLETNWTTLFNFKNHMYIIWICEFKKLATTDMVSIHLLLSTWNPIIVSLVTLEDCKTMAPTFISFCLLGWGGVGVCVLWGEGCSWGEVIIGIQQIWSQTDLDFVIYCVVAVAKSCLSASISLSVKWGYYITMLWGRIKWMKIYVLWNM